MARGPRPSGLTNVPPLLLYDLDNVDLRQRLYTREQIYAKLPHRFEFMQLDAVVHIDRQAEVAVALREVRRDEWWVRCHVPGQPIFPGVLMLETAAHLAAFMTKYIHDYHGFVAFGGVDKCKFRDAVVPPAQLYMICQQLENKSRRIAADCQAVVAGKLVFEAKIIGLPITGGSSRSFDR